MLKKNGVAIFAVVLIVLILPAVASAYGAAHVGYTHVGPNGVYHTGATAAYGPGGAAATSHTTAVGYGGSAYHSSSGAAVGYGGAAGYHYSAGYSAAGAYGSTAHYGYVR